MGGTQTPENGSCVAFDHVAYTALRNCQLWIFGYGSLVWRPDFEYDVCQPAFVKGFKRRFWQGSRDHRGTDENPGRVVTLLPSDDGEETCWGMAYRVPPDRQERVLSYLDVREKDGYSQVIVDIFFPHVNAQEGEGEEESQIAQNSAGAQSPHAQVSSADENENRAPHSSTRALVYIATECNPAYLGPAPVEEMAKQIHETHGPSGPNSEYLFCLAEGMRLMRATDEHTFELESRVKLLKEEEKRIREEQANSVQITQNSINTEDTPAVSNDVGNQS